MGTIHSLYQDVQFALRTFVRNPLFAVTAVLTLAVGIGASTTIFTFVDEIFFQQLPVEEPDRVVAIYGTDETHGQQSLQYFPISRLNYRDFREAATTLSDVAAYTWVRVGLAGDARPEQVRGQIVTGNYFDVLGVSTALGQTFGPETDGTPGASPVVVLSHGFWQRRFGSDFKVIGKTVRINNYPFTIVGVAEKGFKGPYVTHSFDLWVPMAMYEQVLAPSELVNDRSWRAFNLIGRLAPEVPAAQAVAEMEAIATNLVTEYPDDNKGQGVAVMPLADAQVHPNRRGGVRRGALLMSAAVGLMLLIACATVANLLLTRASARRQEIAVRQAMGAGPRRIVRQLLTESTLLALAAAVVGLLFAYWWRGLLWSFKPELFMDHSLDLGLDGRVLFFTVLLSLATVILFGLVPALRATRFDLLSSLKAQSQTEPVRRRSKVRLRHSLLALQTALCLIALVGAGLFVRSLQRILEVDPGFESRRLVLMSFDVDSQGYDEPRAQAFYRQLLERVGTIPGVEAAALARNGPLDQPVLVQTLKAEGDASSDDGLLLQTNPVTHGYFETLGIARLEGRGFRDVDTETSRPVAIINETTAARVWPGESPVGRRFRFDGKGDPVEVIGIVADSKYNSLNEEAKPYVYLSLAQSYTPRLTLHARTAGDPAAVLATVREEAQQLDAGLPILNAATVGDVIGKSLRVPRMAATLLSLFGFLALTLAAVGTYGVIAYSVSRRRHEIGVRMALGAQRQDILWMVVKPGLAVVGVGALIGFVVAWTSSRLLSSLLYGIAATDLTTFAGAALLLLAVALLACVQPARRAAGVDPAITLRSG